MFNGLFVEVKQQTENLYSKYNGFYIEKYIYKYPNTILFLENFKKNVKLTSSVMTFLKPLMKLFLKTCLSSFRRQEITNGTNILSSSTSHNLIILVKVGEVCLWKLSEFYFHSITSLISCHFSSQIKVAYVYTFGLFTIFLKYGKFNWSWGSLWGRRFRFFAGQFLWRLALLARAG